MEELDDERRLSTVSYMLPSWPRYLPIESGDSREGLDFDLKMLDEVFFPSLMFSRARRRWGPS